MTTKQKVRAMRRFARKMMDTEEFAAMEIGAFHAPSECWDLIIPSLQRQTERAFKQIGLSSLDWNDEMRRYIEIESQFTKFHYEPPMAWCEWTEIEGLLSPYSG